MFDWGPVRAAFFAGEYSRCRELLQGAPSPESVIWVARMEIRANRNPEAIALLLNMSPRDERSAAERDIWLASAYCESDRALTHQLLDRALPVLRPYAEPYYRGLHTRSLTHLLSSEFDASLRCIEELLESPYAIDRAQAYSQRSWIAAKQEDIRAQLRYLQLSLDQHLQCDPIDQYAFLHMLVTLGSLCREVPTDGVIDRLRAAFGYARKTEITDFSWFTMLRVLGWIDALQGDEVAAVRRFREAEACAPSAFWRVFCLVDRAYLSDAMDRQAAARETLAEADAQAWSLDWSSTHQEERIILVTLAQLYASKDPARAQAYLAKFRSLRTEMHGRIGWLHDRRTRALQLSAHGTALLHLGDREAGIAMLSEAWEIFTAFKYDWRAALAALTLFEATTDDLWRERARKQIAPWPDSWIARRV
ncbi:MAG TPA: hypothetical protein VFN37_14395 [Candidatus Baltobacteraceae bacterium]|nr:hypothetical protein [Candidatus Baltobacteraceae bacterium]